MNHVLIDTGSGGTVFAADQLSNIGVVPEPQDPLRRIAGVGGVEYVFEKTIEHLAVGDLAIASFPIEVGALNYGFVINGILGIDFLMAVGAIINLKDLTYCPNTHERPLFDEVIPGLKKRGDVFLAVVGLRDPDGFLSNEVGEMITHELLHAQYFVDRSYRATVNSYSRR